MRVDDELIDIASSVADGSPVDWDELRDRVGNDDRAVVDALRVVSVLAGMHRTLAEPAEPPLTATTSTRPQAGVQSELGGFLLMERLGGGSQGEVYRAFDTRLERDVALKLRHLPGAGTDLTHTLREGRLLAKVRHKHIVAVYGIEVVGDHVGISMEMVQGETLDTIVRRDGPMPAATAASIVFDLCAAVEAVHSAGLIHRDIKAQNVVLEHGGRVVLMDFGTGALQHDVKRFGQGGTPLYLAPELVIGGAASVRSDVYAIGVLFYYLLSGRFPYDARSYDELRQQVKARASHPISHVVPDLPAPFALVVEKCLAIDPALRFQSAAAIGEALAEIIKPIGEPSPTRTEPHRSTLKDALFVGLPAAAMVAVAVGVAVWDRTPVAPVETPVVAIRPLDDLTGDAQSAALALGLTESLTQELGRYEKIRVVASDSMREAERSDRLTDLVQRAGVTTFIDGTLEFVGPSARLTLRAVDAKSQARLWVATLERDKRELMTLQDALVGEIASRFSLALSPALKRARDQRPPVPLEAMEAYYRGWAEFIQLTFGATVNAVRQFRRALELAPEFAPAHSSLAYAEWLLGTSYAANSGITQDQAYAAAITGLNKALALDPDWAHAHAVLGLLTFSVDWNWARAEEHFLKAITLNPSDANVRGYYAQLLMLQNRSGAALAEARLAQKLDPLSLHRQSAVSASFYYARRYDQAIAEMEALQRSHPNAPIPHFALARYYSAVGRFDDALRQLETAPYSETTAPPRAEYARILAAAGRTDQARAMLPELLDFYQNRRLAADYLAYVYVALSEHERALSLLEEAWQARSSSLVWAHVDPRFDALRLRPEFRSLMNRLGFAQ